MSLPQDIKYTDDHEWARFENNVITIGITDFAQKELGEIVFLEIDTLDEELEKEEIFGTIEAVKTVSDLFMPITGIVLEINKDLDDNPELINESPYDKGWIIKVKLNQEVDLKGLLSSSAYKNLIS